MRKIDKSKVFIFIITIITLLLLFFFFKEIILEIIKLYIDNNVSEVKTLLENKGLIGCVAVILVEALQMVVVFISAEFIQISAGLSYPWYLALLLCELGVGLGATIIYFLVKVLKFDTSIFSKANDKIGNISKKKKNTNIQILMYLFFIMPIIPFGAICYFGSNTKISYRRYIFTCVTGVIPSILTSILMGKIITFALIKDIPFWQIILMIIIIMLLLIILGFVFVNKTLLKDAEGTPDSAYYNIFYRIFQFFVKRKVNCELDKLPINTIDGPFVLLTNHPSTLDVYYAAASLYPIKMSFIMNKYYFKNKILKYYLSKFGTIPKKLFSPDIGTIKKTLKAVKAGYPIFMCPEGRLGVDGTNYYVTRETGKFIKQLKLPIVIMTINGAYLSNPKWRKKRIKAKVQTKITKIITKEEVLSKEVIEINDLINDNIKYNDFDFVKQNNLSYKYKKKAEGLENLLYYCPHCKHEFTLSTKGNNIKCNHCGFNLDIKDDYHFTDNEYGINTIHDWYLLMVDYEKENIKNGIDLSCDVYIKKFNIDNKKMNEKGIGVCHLSNFEFTYEGNLKVSSFTISIDKIKALAFSCGEEFECYYNDELYYFYPITNKKQCSKWALIVDELVKTYEE